LRTSESKILYEIPEDRSAVCEISDKTEAPYQSKGLACDE